MRLALPLIISTGAGSLQMVIDRIFLTWYSADAMAGAMQAGIASLTITSLFIGTASYVNTFVAQYSGAGRDERTGPAVWQGIYFSLLAGILMLLFVPLTGPLFDWMRHDQPIRHYEVVYFQIMCVGAMPMLVASALSSFFTGRGRNAVVMYVNVGATAVNIVLDYALIFGKLGLPRWGVAGAAWATVIAFVFSMLAYFWLFAGHCYRKQCATISGYRFDYELFRRLLRYGFPNGVQFFLDICAFAIFVMLVGRISRIGLSATSIAFGINTIAFMPMVGLGISVSTLVGQALGKNQPSLAQRSTWSGFIMTYTYMAVLALGYWFLPELFLYPFSIGADKSEFAAIEPVAVKLLCFVAFYCLFDTGNIIFSAALRGAGDTRFVMVVAAVLGWLIMVFPSWLAVKYGFGLYAVWGFATAYVCLLAIVFLLRFLAGKWKNMRVIEAIPLPMPLKMSDVPAADIEAR